MSTSLLTLDLRAVLDLLGVFVVAWITIHRLRRGRAHLALVGMLLLAGLYILVRWIELELTAWLLRGALVVTAFLVVLAFQDDLRRLVERLGSLGFGKGRRDGSAVDTLCEVAAQLAARKIGALIVIPGAEPVQRWANGMVHLDGELSQPILLSIFDPHSAGHDGAVVLSTDGRIEGFAAHLPLSTDDARIGGYGTRHAAALGLSERCDALSLVVSEERGMISIAESGRLQEVEALELPKRIRDHTHGRPSVRPRLRKRALVVAGEMVAAAALTFGAWLLLVPGAAHDSVELMATVAAENVPEAFVVREIHPQEIPVRVAGSRRRLFLLQESDVSVAIDAQAMALGRRTFHVTADDVQTPEDVEVVDLPAPLVEVEAERNPTAAPPNAP